MLPINLLQSQLAHNKKRINELQAFVKEYLFDIKSTNEHIKSLEGDAHAQDYVSHLMYEKLQYVKMLQKTRKQLKQLAILQKSIKFEINRQSFWIAQLVKKTMNNIQGDTDE